jgi:hypothetical protein
MLTALRAVISVINAVLHLVAVALVTGGSVLIGAVVVLIVVVAILAISGVGLFGMSRRKRPKP